MAMIYEDVEDILEDVLIEEPDLLIVRKWLVKWKHLNGTYEHSWEPYESVAHLPKFEQYENAKKTGTLSSNKGDGVIVKQYTEEQYEELVKQEQRISCGTLCGDSWGYYDNKDNYTNKQKNKIKKFKKLFDINDDNENENDEDFDIRDEIQTIRKIKSCQKRCKTLNKSAVMVETNDIDGISDKNIAKKSRKKQKSCNRTTTSSVSSIQLSETILPKQPAKPPPPPPSPNKVEDNIEKTEFKNEKKEEIMELKRKIESLQNELESEKLKNKEESPLGSIPKKIKNYRISTKMRNNKYKYDPHNEIKTNRDESISVSSLGLISKMKSNQKTQKWNENNTNNTDPENTDNNKYNETKTNRDESTFNLIPQMESLRNVQKIKKFNGYNGGNNAYNNGYNNYAIYQKKRFWNNDNYSFNNNNFIPNKTEYHDNYYNNNNKYNNNNYNGNINKRCGYNFHNPPKKRKFNGTYRNIVYPNYDNKPQQNISMYIDSDEANQRSICIKSIPPSYNRRNFRAEIENKYNVKIKKCDDLTTDIPPFLRCNRLELNTMQGRNKLLKLGQDFKLSLQNDFISATEYMLI